MRSNSLSDCPLFVPGNESCGLPFNQNLLTYYCDSDDDTPLAKLQQDMFEKHPGNCL